MIQMNEQNLQGNADQNNPVTTYLFDSHRNSSDLKAAYEKELGINLGRPLSSGNRGNQSRRRSGQSVRTMLASFLVGAVVIGGFSYMADKENLFSGGEPAIIDQGGSTSPQASGASTVALNTSGDIASVYETASPAVVKIENYTAAAQTNPTMNDFFFGGGQGGRQQQQQKQGSELVLAGAGSGFFFADDGYILTNEHVIADATEVKVTVEGYEEPLTAKVVGSSYELDLAVLKVENPDAKAFPALALGNSDETAIGDWVIAIGNPYGFDHTLTMGVLSSKERPITITDEQGDHEYKNLLQTDASINPGNSGGPLLNEQGEVIGMNTAVNAEAQGIGFAIPTTTIMDAMDKLMTNTL
jgi:serine protease Do